MKRNVLNIVILWAIICLASCSSLFGPQPNNTKPDNDPTDTITTPQEPDDPNLPGDSIDNRTPDQIRNFAYLYDLNAVPQITVEVEESEWNKLLFAFDENPNTRDYVLARFIFNKDGEIYTRDSVGLRLRGNTSRRRPEGTTGQPHSRNSAEWHQSHFGIKFTEYQTGERFFGTDRLILKFFNNDPDYCREIFCYDLFRRFGVWTAPYASYCRLSIHVKGDDKPAYYGVYAMIQGVRKGWLANNRKEGHIPDSDGNLWKASWGSGTCADLSDFYQTGTSKMGIADNWNNYSYALKSNKNQGLGAAQQELYNFMENMRPLPSGSDELKTYLEQNMDVDLFLRFLAVNVMVGMWDDYWINGNNYFFYFDSNHKFYFIPFDYDNTLGTLWGQIYSMTNPATHDMLHWGSREGDRLLVRKVLSIAEYENTYKQYIKQIAASPDLMQPDAAIERVRAFQALVRNYVNNDTGDNMQLYDESAGTLGYKLLSGDDSGQYGSNYFKTKVNSINF